MRDEGNRLTIMIRARMRSDRFPNKSTALLAGVPMIGRILQRLHMVTGYDEIVLSTTQLSEDDELCAAFKEYGGTAVYRGPETNLLLRDIGCMEAAGARYVMIISGDSPFLDPKACQAEINAAVQHWDEDFDRLMPARYHANVGADVFGGPIQSVQTYRNYQKYIYAGYAKTWIPECYWRVDGENKYQEMYPIKEIKFDGDEFMPREKTPIKCSIDYPLELAFWNRVIELMGHYPENFNEIYDAFKTIKEL